MDRYRLLLRCVGGAVAEHGLRCLLGTVPFAEKLWDIARDAYERYRQECESAERLAQVEAAARASLQEVRQEVVEVLQEVMAQAAPEVRQHLQAPAVQTALAGYLQQVPASIRRSMRRPADPSGRSVPVGFKLQSAEDFLRLLPARPSRFKEGDYPLANVDLELVELLGIGGFGEVWKARNPYQPHDPPVALKFCLDPAAAASLRHEAALLNRVKSQGTHAGIVKLLRTYLRADPPTLEYEYIEGGDLAGLIQEHARGLSPQDAATVVLRLVRIVGFAHRLNPPIVHRDLKPANILVQRAGDGEPELKVADFGIGGVAAKQAIVESLGDTTRGLVQATVARGSYTLLYASPQQMAGKEADPRDDVYALGVIWHQLLTGDVTKGRPGGSRWLDRLVERGMSLGMGKLLETCFEDDPEDRPCDAGDLADQLANLCSDTTIPARAGQEVEVPLAGEWLVRPGNQSGGEWQAVTRMPGRVSLWPGEVYWLRIDSGVTDRELGGLDVLRGVTNLQALSLCGCNKVTDTGLSHLKGFTALHHLDLEWCHQVTDAGLAHLKGLTSLQRLDLNYCEQVTDAGLAHLKGLPALQNLGLRACYQVTDAGLSHLKGLASLQGLDLGGCEQVTDAGLAHLKGLASLQELSLNHCEQVTDAGLAYLKALTSLHHLDLNYCHRVTDAGLAHLKGLTSLQQLNLNYCEQVTDAGLAHLKGLTALQHLDLDGCKQVTDAGLAHLKGLTFLQVLSLSDCKRVTEAGLSHLKGLTSLQVLWLSHCEQVSDTGLSHLKGLTSLRELSLFGCKRVTDVGLSHLKGLTSLQELSLSECEQVTDKGLAHLKGLASLQRLGLRDCNQVTDAGKVAIQRAIPGLEFG